MTEDEAEDRDLWDEKAVCWERHIGDEGDRNRRLHVGPVVERFLGDVEGLAVLDAGCGTGYLSAKLTRAGAAVTAVDYAPRMVEHARAKAARQGVSLEARVDDCCRLETVPSGSQDVVVSVYVLQDLGDLPGAVSSFRRVLKPGGRAVLVFGHPCFGSPGGPLRAEDGAVSYTWPFSYFEERRCEETWDGTDHRTQERFTFPSQFTFYHRPLSSYWRAFREHGFACLDFDEPVLQPPFPDGMSEEEGQALRRCSWSVAFHLERKD